MISASVLKKRSSTMRKRKRTEKSKYKHQTTGDHCTCAAYVAEMMCIRNAEHKNKGHLPHRFWNKKPWDWTFKRQLYAANKIIKEHGEEALVKAVHSSEFKGIYSLNNKRAIGIIKKYEIIIAQNSNKKQELEIKDNPKKRSKNFGKRSSLDKLRRIELDGKEEEE
mgnify:CR=1 FL=1